MNLTREQLLLKHALAALNSVHPYGYDGAWEHKGSPRHRPMVTPHMTYTLCTAIERYFEMQGLSAYDDTVNAALDVEPTV